MEALTATRVAATTLSADDTPLRELFATGNYWTSDEKFRTLLDEGQIREEPDTAEVKLEFFKFDGAYSELQALDYLKREGLERPTVRDVLRIGIYRPRFYKGQEPFRATTFFHEPLPAPLEKGSLVSTVEGRFGPALNFGFMDQWPVRAHIVGRRK